MTSKQKKVVTPVSYTHLDVYKRQGEYHSSRPLKGICQKNLLTASNVACISSSVWASDRNMASN